MAKIRLIVKHERLHFPTGGEDNGPSMLIRFYAAGDCDTCPWPTIMDEEHRRRLAVALYGERECNDTYQYGDVIELPDGTLFDVDNELPEG